MANSFVKPTVIPEIWSAGGQHTSIDDITTERGRASFQKGFPEETSTPIASGGVPPKRQDFNAMGYIPMSHNFFAQNGGCYTFDTEVSNAIGGYPEGAILWVWENNKPSYPVVSMKNGNSDNFVSTPSFINGTSWRKLGLNAAGDAMAGTLSDQQAAQVRNIVLTDTVPATGVDGTIYFVMEN
ncbi:MAG: hypothetical protein II304_01275 [Bacteroidales bacterium]|nr:hypothetical protein [Bacteroidales bacterium]